MKKIYTLIIAAVVCAPSAKAQFTMLQAYHEPATTVDNNIGDMRRYDSISALPNTPGSGQNWDFTSMQITTVVVTTTYVPSSAAPHASLFAGTNIAGKHNNNDYTYYKSDTVAKQFEVLGSVSGTSTTSYSDTRIWYKWPITSTSAYSDTYAWSDGANNATGTFSVAATGSGNLMLVGVKTFTNVMQLTSHDQSTLTSLGDTAMMHTTTYAYFWNMNRYPLLVVRYTSVMMDTLEFKSYNILVNWLEAVGLTDNSFESDYALYPNPADNHFEIKLSNNAMDKCTITIQGINGQAIKTLDLGSAALIETKVDVSDLPKGVYIVRTRLGDRHGVKKLIIE